ncbi:MAG: hypothetical protein GX472_02385 [Methanomicrobiales archaeon]|nr:hypothetical protein [Methanomicrobiales archaeon]
MPVPPAITRIIEEYRVSGPAYCEGKISRQALCRDFIDPFLESLGWERQAGDSLGQSSGLLLDVPVRIGGEAGSIDYILCSQKGGALAIMVTDCPPAEESAFLLIRYAWNAGLDLAILTNLRESALYNTTTPVQCRDDVAEALITRLGIGQYEEHWDHIAALLSHEGITRDSIGLFLKGQGIRETSRIGLVLRKDLEVWRAKLAKKIALRNHGVTEASLSDLVHALIIRILFLRIIEDKGLGQEGVLMRITGGGSAYGRLCGLFRYACEEYGGGLFCCSDRGEKLESPQSMIFSLSVDDDTIKNIIARLSPEEGPYEFSVIPARVLASVFSPYLGSVIRIRNGHQAVIEECSEFRKYGIPSPVQCEMAEYVVRRTVSNLVKEKTVQELQHLHLLDPACGSGLFLVMAFESLLEWHRAWYFRNLLPLLKQGNFSHDDIQPFLPEGAERKGEDVILPFIIIHGTEGIHPVRQLTIRLTPAERKRILLSILSGVDIDRRAVEITMVILLVALMEGGDRQGLPLPDLSSCIRCGNSLVGPDFLNDPDTALIDPGTRERISVFNWDNAFPHIIGSGGFDGIIGSFPAHRCEPLKGEKGYLEKHYRCYPQSGELYPCFVEKGIFLLKQGGLLSAAFPDVWLRSKQGSKLRHFLSGSGIQEIIAPGIRERENPLIPRTCIVTVSKEEPGESISVVQGVIPATGNFVEYLNKNRYCIPRWRIGQGSWILADTCTQDLVSKIQGEGTPLAEYVMGALSRGIKRADYSPQLIDSVSKKRVIAEDVESGTIIRPFITPERLRRYYFLPPKWYLLLTSSGITVKDHPALVHHPRNQTKEMVRKERRVGEWTDEKTMPDAYSSFPLPVEERQSDLIASPKILFPCIARESRFSLDSTGHYCPDTCGIIHSSSLYLLGLLNSRLIWFLIKETLPPLPGGYRNLCSPFFENIPIYVPDFENREEVTRHDTIETMVRQMIALYGKISEMEDPAIKAPYRKQIGEIDHAIDHLVYDLYHLTSGEIRIIEKAASGPDHPS